MSKVTDKADNGLRDWPIDWPWYKQACFPNWEDRCDMLVGPCACGAWHQEGEFEFSGDLLKRYGKEVPCTPHIKSQ